MTAPLRVAGIVGSLRQASFNRRLMAAAVQLAPPGMAIEVADVLRLPLMDEDLEVDGFPPEVQTLHATITEADAVLLATPEYNFGIPGPVKNLVDWASRPPGRSCLSGKPVMLMGASTGKAGGTLQAQGALRVSLAVTGALVLPWPPVVVADVAAKFDGDALVDEMTTRTLGFALGRFAEWIAAFRAPAAGG